jgi:3-isopropylmalate/(R)-2-methylmalate dehydratase small subunit
MDQYTFKGRLWIVSGSDGLLIEDIDTDQIFHNAHLHITEIDEMGRHAFGNLDGWEDFPEKAEPGDILLVGRNFGAGSSRQQAVDCFKALGIRLIIAASFGAIYKRNAINSGFPIFSLRDADEIVSAGDLKQNQTVVVNMLEGRISAEGSGREFQMSPFSKVQKDIFDKGTLLKI